MRAIAVHPDKQGSGRGARLVAAAEAELASRHQRSLIVDTSGTEAFAATRRLYNHLGDNQLATIPEFRALEDDIVTFAKSL